MSTPTSDPTDQWLAHTAEVMPPLEGPSGTAERLLLLVHYGVDWEASWVASRRRTYWAEVLPDRVIAATYRTTSLRHWWREVTEELASAPRNAAERTETERLLRAEPLPVLQLLRTETEPLLLRTRIVAEAVRAARPAKTPTGGEGA